MLRSKQNECECGRTKNARRVACELCSFLDGTRDTESEIIAALRTVTPLSTSELIEIVGLERSNMFHAIKRLIRNGRVKRVEVEPEMVEVAGFGLGGGRSHFYELVSL